MRNLAGGETEAMTIWETLNNFLIIGSDLPTYYGTKEDKKELTSENLRRCIEENPQRVVDSIVEVSLSDRAPKVDPVIYALAITWKNSVPTRKAIAEVFNQVIRTGTHLFQFISYLGRNYSNSSACRALIANWYHSLSDKKLVYQMLKYREREGWSHRDVLRTAHIKPATEREQEMFAWVCEKGGGPSNDACFDAFIRAQKATTEQEVAHAITDGELTHEMIPTQWKKSHLVWDALLPHMPLTALVRNLASMGANKYLVDKSHAASFIAEKLDNDEWIHASHMHPVNILMAHHMYSSGRSERASWEPVDKVVDALEAAFYAAFPNVKSSGRRYLLALDISGSMGISYSAGMSARMLSAAMVLATMNAEPNSVVVGYSDSIIPLDIDPNMRLGTVMKKVSNLPFGGTNCALPFWYAMDKDQKYDVMVSYTDNESWIGAITPMQALSQYREVYGECKAVACATATSNYSIFSGAGCLNIAGFDSAAPALISNF